MSEPWLIGVLVLAGVAAGFINTMAGGGSLLTLPALMLLGLPANVANGTNRLSVVTQSLSGVFLFHRRGKLETGAIAPVLAPTIVGSLAGAGVAAVAPAWILEPVMLVILVVIALTMALTSPHAVAGDEAPKPFSLGSWLGMFGAGLYGGFIQAGVGFVLLAVLASGLRYDLVRANALKLVCTSVFGVVALGIFVIAGQVRWLPAAALAVSTVAGSQLGVRFALKVNPKVIRWVIVACVVASCVAVWLR